MARALALARRGLGSTSPNPPVGAVLVRGGALVAEGWHKAAGTAHAEAVALSAAGERARGATLYVTLEPCVHTEKRTPPCVPAIVAAGVAEVVVGCEDPNPAVAGRGLAALREAGVRVRVGVLREAAQRLIGAYATRLAIGRPRVLLKAGMSADGKVATSTGESRWITCEAARTAAHLLRAKADAVIVGVGTVLADDPRLTCRVNPLSLPQPLRVIVDSTCRTPPHARLFEEEGAVLVACTAAAPPERAEGLRRAGAEVVPFGGGGRVDLEALLWELAHRGCNLALVEGGPTLAGAMIDAGLVDEVRLFVAPLLLGGGRGVAEGTGPPTLAGAWRLEGFRARRVGRCVELWGTVERGGVQGCSRG